MRPSVPARRPRRAGALRSTILTVASVVLIVVFAAMAAFVLQRRAGRNSAPVRHPRA